MGCKHRFYNELIPDWEIEHLFVGTFNPEWDKESGNNAKYFYERKSNNFWCILPEIFNQHLKFDDMNNKEELKSFLRKNRIGCTDLIKEVINADVSDSKAKSEILSFQDKYLDTYDLIDNLEGIREIIKRNQNIKGIYLTRSTLVKGKTSSLWSELKNEFGNRIHFEQLITPSGYGGGCREVYDDWKKKFKI